LGDEGAGHTLKQTLIGRPAPFILTNMKNYQFSRQRRTTL